MPVEVVQKLLDSLHLQVAVLHKACLRRKVVAAVAVNKNVTSATAWTSDRLTHLQIQLCDSAVKPHRWHIQGSRGAGPAEAKLAETAAPGSAFAARAQR